MKPDKTRTNDGSLESKNSHGHTAEQGKRASGDRGNAVGSDSGCRGGGRRGAARDDDAGDGGLGARATRGSGQVAEDGGRGDGRRRDREAGAGRLAGAGAGDGRRLGRAGGRRGLGPSGAASGAASGGGGRGTLAAAATDDLEREAVLEDGLVGLEGDHNAVGREAAQVLANLPAEGALLAINRTRDGGNDVQLPGRRPAEQTDRDRTLLGGFGARRPDDFICRSGRDLLALCWLGDWVEPINLRHGSGRKGEDGRD